MQKYIILTLATLILSQAGNLIRFADTNPVSVAFYRLLIASCIILPFSLKTIKISRALLGRSVLFRLILMGIFFALHFLFWIKAVQMTKVANAAICFALNPVFISIGAVIFFKEKISKITILSLALSFAGIVALSYGDLVAHEMGYSDFTGDWLSVLAALCFAIYFLIGKSMRNKLDNRVVMSSVYLVGAIFSLIVIFFMDLPIRGFSTTTWVALGSLAFFQTILGHASIIYVLKFFKASFVSTFLLLEPLLAGIVAFFLFAEKITFSAGIGYVLISLGILLLFRSDANS